MNRSETKSKNFKKLFNQIIKYVKRKKQKQEFTELIGSIRSLLSEKRDVPTKKFEFC